ncbi:MAG: TonB-dependent receptor [Saprospiraceae bacterium]
MFNFVGSPALKGRKISWNLFGSMVAGLAFPFTLSAQLDTLQQHHQNQLLSEVVVQATRAGLKSPVPHSNFQTEKIQSQYHAQDIPYLLSSVPSLVETSDGGIGIGYTGLRIRGSDPTRINVNINGVPLNDAESQGVFWVDLPDLATSATEIQVQRGVGTSTNGAGAFGSSVNINISKVEPERFATISNTLGAFGTRKHAVHIGTGLMDGKLAFSARISGIYSDGFVDRASVDMNSIHLSGAYVDERQSFQAHLLSGHEITYQAWNGLPAQYLENHAIRTFNTAGTDRPGSPYPDEIDDYTQRHYLAHYKRVLSPELHLQLNGHYTKGFGFFEQYKGGQSLGDYGLPIGFAIDTVIPPLDLVLRRWLNNDFFGGTFGLRWQSKSIWKPVLLLGGAWSRYAGLHYGEVIWAEAFTGAPNDYRYYENKGNKQDANVYLKVEAAPTQKFSAFLDLQIRGIRYDFLGFDNELNNVQQVSNHSFFNPKIGGTYSFSNNWQAYTFLGVGHREPNRDDYTQSTPSSRPKAEQMLDIEAGIRRNGIKWAASANFYWMRYKDQLVLDGRINDVGAYIRTNVPDSWRKGLELEASALIGNYLRLLGNASFSENKIRIFYEYLDNWDTEEQIKVLHFNSDLAFSPNVTTRGEATFVFKSRKTWEASTTLIGKYVSRQFLDNSSNSQTSMPSYLTCDLRLNFDLAQVIGKQVSMIFTVHNFLDAKYVSNGWAYRYISAGYDDRPNNAYTRFEGNDVYHQAGFFPQAGRHWMATLRMGF